MVQIRSRILALLTIGIFLIDYAHAQVSVNSSGGDATSSGGTVAYSIGQVVYTSEVSSSGSVAKGVQYAYQVLPLGNWEDENDISITAFPNPAADVLTLRISGDVSLDLSCHLVNFQGIVFNDKKVTSYQTYMHLENLTPGTYTLNILNSGNKIIRSFKIVKK